MDYEGTEVIGKWEWRLNGGEWQHCAEPADGITRLEEDLGATYVTFDSSEGKYDYRIKLEEV
jgi:hypothetical protein